MVANQQQVDAWNGGESVHYVAHADRYDRQLEPFSQALLERADLGQHHVVLDVGCGCGSTTNAAAGRVARAVGLDLSEPLLAIARGRARAASIDNVDFVVADAQTCDLAGQGFDRIISQFGLMFFDDPEAAFANLHRALRPGGTLTFVCWQPLQANEWLMVLGEAVRRVAALPDFGGRAGGPGMFGLRDPDEIAALLHDAGFVDVRCEPLTPSILLAGGGSADDAIEFLLGMGMARGLLGLVEPAERDAVIESVRVELERRHEPDVGIRLGAAGWLVAARS